jgi:hypothetical protein
MGEIVRLIDYLAGRSSGQPNNPFWFKRNNPYGNIGPATIADSIGNTFDPTYLPQQGSPWILPLLSRGRALYCNV